MVDTLLRGIPYYLVFILLFVIYRRYNNILFLIEQIGMSTSFGNAVVSKNLLERKRKQQLNYAYFILLFFFGLRGYVYTDFINYKPFFDILDGVKNIPEVLLLKGWEPGFVVYSALCKMFIPNYFVWNAISTLIDLFLLYKVLERYSNNHLLSLLVFFIIGSSALEFNVLRNAKAIFIFLYSLRYIEERKMFKYFTLIMVASLFHISSILYFPLYFILHKQWPQWMLWLIYIGGVLIMFLHIGFVSELVSYIPFVEGSRTEYLASHLENNVAYSSIFGNMERILTMLILILSYRKIAKNNKGNYMFLNMYILLYAAFTLCSESVVMVQRFQYMFIASFWVLYPLLFEYAKRYKNSIIYTFIISMLFFKLSIIAADPNLKYENVLTGVSNYEDRVIYTERNLGK